MDEPVSPQRVSLRDIGRLANLSHSTVSLALRDHPSIAAKTKVRVRQLAASLGYAPDPMLRALAEYRRDKAVRRYQGSLAWIHYGSSLNVNVGHEFILYRQGAEQRAAELGYKLVDFNPTVDKMTPAALRRVLLNSGIRGLLFPPQPQAHTILDFDFSNFSAIAFGFSISVPQLHVVTNCQFRTSMIALRQLRAFGYKRIGLVLSEALNERSQGNFLGGFLAEQNKINTRERIPVFLSRGPWDNEQKKFNQWFKTHRPEVIIADFFEWTVGYLQELGLHVPEDIPLAVLAAMPHLHKFAGMDQNDRRVGQLAVDTVVGMLYRNETGIPATPTRILVEGQWQSGESIPLSKFTSVS